jgi:hypothetical protein
MAISMSGEPYAGANRRRKPIEPKELKSGAGRGIEPHDPKVGEF